MGATTIAWTGAVWNPVRGCALVSAGCEHCYAMRFAGRFSGDGQPYEGLTQPTKKGHVWTGEARFVQEILSAPLRWKTPRRVFVNSMSDLFHKDITNGEIAAVFAVMAAAPQHTFQVLTKRPERMREWFEWVRSAGQALRDAVGIEPPSGSAEPSACALAAPTGAIDVRSLLPQFGRTCWPLPNVWLGVSAEDQESAGKRIPYLLKTPAAVRFVSAEPLLGPLDLRTIWGFGEFTKPLTGEHVRVNQNSGFSTSTMGPGLDWVIVGGESGPNARPCDVQWVRAIVQQCKHSGVPAFVKQLGARPYESPRTDGSTGCDLPLHDRKGADMSEWPEDLRVREFPETV